MCLVVLPMTVPLLCKRFPRKVGDSWFTDQDESQFEHKAQAKMLQLHNNTHGRSSAMGPFVLSLVKNSAKPLIRVLPDLQLLPVLINSSAVWTLQMYHTLLELLLTQTQAIMGMEPL